MIYELREYVAVPGEVDKLHARFAEHTMALFAKHGMTVEGFFADSDDPNRLVYLLSFLDEQSKQTAWQNFGDDEEWQRVKQESEQDGPIVAEMHSRSLNAVPYWTPRG